MNERFLTLVRLFVFFGGLFVLALFAALIGPYFIDWSSYREDFEREAGRILGQNVQVLGEADARLLPFPSVSFGNVIVGEGDDGRPMMTIERFSMDVELAPFLSGEIRIFDMRIDSPRGALRLSRQGELDWALRSEKSLPRQALTLESIKVTNGQALLIDEQSGREHRVRDLNMTMSAKSIAGPWEMEGTGEIDGYSGGFELQTGTRLEENRIRLKARILPDVLPVSVELEGDLRIEDLKPQYKGSFDLRVLDADQIQNKDRGQAKGSRRPLYVRANGIFELTNERLRIEDYRLETGLANDPYVISGEATVDTGRDPEFLLIADGQQLNLSRMDEAGANGQQDGAAGESISLAQRLGTLQRLISLAPVPQMPGRVSVALPAVLAGDTTIRDVLMEARPDGAVWRIDRIEAKLPGRTQFLASGQLGVGSNFGFSGEVIVASNQPSGFAAWLTNGVDPAIRRLEAAGLSAKVDLSQQLQRFDDLEIAVGAAILKGRLERIVPIQGRPSLSLVLDGDEVDFDALRALTGIVVGENQESRLAGHDVSARLSAEAFRSSGVVANGADVAVRLKGGTLDIDRLTVGDLAGASISGVGRLDSIFSAPVGNVDLSILADSSGQLFELLSGLSDQHPVLAHLRDSAALFSDTTIDVQSQFAPGIDEQTSLAARIRGRTGGSRFSIFLERDDAFAPLDNGQLSITADISSNEPRNLLAQMGIESLPVDLDGSAAVDVSFEGVPAEELDFSINYDAPDMLVSARGRGWQDDGRRLQADFKLSLASDDLTPYLSMNGLNIVDPASSMAVQIETDVRTDPQSYQLSNLTGRAADMEFSGELALARDADIFDLSGMLETSDIDLAWLAELMLGPGTVVSGGPSWATASFLSPLQDNLAVDLELNAPSVHVPGASPAGPWSGRVVLKDNEMQLRDMRADWMGGSLEGAITLANRDASALISGQIQLKDADLRPVIWSHDGFPVATGRFDLSASFEGAGTSQQDVVGSLSGSGIIDIGGLDLEGFENESLMPILMAADEEGFELDGRNIEELVENVLSNGKFFAGEVSLPFTMAAGTLRMPNIDMSDTGATVRGEARLSLVEEIVNARFSVEFDPEDEALTGAAPAVTLAFRGPLRQPIRSLDVSEMANFLSLRAFERERRRVEILQAVVLENQRLRREALLAKQRADSDRDAALRRRQLEEERAANERNRIEQERVARLEEEQRAREEAEAAALLAEEEEEARLLDEAQQRAAREFAERLARGEAAPPTQQDEFILQLEDAVRRAGETGGTGQIERQPLPELKFDFESYSD
ncbi:MAG: AsmA family protein [Pseudomonadota bacterium]